MNKGIVFMFGVAAGGVAMYIVEEIRHQKKLEERTKKLQDEFLASRKKDKAKTENDDEKGLVDLFHESLEDGDDTELMARLGAIMNELDEEEEYEEEIEVEEVPEGLMEMEDYPDGFPGRLMSNLEAATIRYDMEQVVREEGYGDPNERAAVKPYLIDPVIFGTNDAYTYVTMTYYADGRLADDLDELIDPDDWEDLIGTEALEAFGIEPQQECIVTVRNERLMCDIEVYKDARPYTDILKEKPQLMHQFQDMEDDE